MRSFFLSCLLLAVLLVHGQAPSPDAFLGYPVGTRYTPHHRIVAYFEELARRAPDRMKLERYGATNEGRPLMAAFISTPENIARLENIRANNVSMAQGKGGAPDGMPVIVWLSYNVHGNEPSSSEAALRTAWALLGGEPRTQAWLRNTVVVIDPCINPDGRDRYVNWFNSVSGNTPNAQLSAREHSEPWPGGRVNHYYFDLNRDWAWQTQAETRARLPLYQRWMPQVHVDFHEQGINNPYYFAPAAEPFHEAITPWQRRFQELIGRNHARYFDQAGWLYFTREVFDLFYPAYGDTYPLFNGAIGMTYEQAGGPAGGLAALTASGDTLTLADRVAHHYTTGLSTVETASNNAAQLLGEFRKYFSDAVAGKEFPYKQYVIKARAGDEARIAALRDLLQRNGIPADGGLAGSGRGFQYSSGRNNVSFTVEPQDLVIDGRTAQGNLLRVLFEPNPRLSDSVTYDITAWALPYVYGVEAYAAPEALPLRARSLNTTTEAIPSLSYGFVVPWNGIRTARFTAGLLQQGYRLRFAERPFSLNGRSFGPGSLIVLRAANTAGWAGLEQQVQQAGFPIYPVTTAMVDKGLDFGSSSVRPLRAPRVALLSGEGSNPNSVGEVWHFFEQELHYPVTLVNTTDFGRTDWSRFDVVVMANGNYRFLNDKTTAEGLRSWVQKGGRLIAMEGAMGQLAGLDWGLKQRRDDDTSGSSYDALRRYADREREEVSGFTPGAIYRVALDNTHPLAFGYNDTYYTLRQDDRAYDFFHEGGWNVGVVKKEKPVAGFVGQRLQPRLQDALVIGVQDLGNGQVVYFADDVLFRNFWENGKLLFANAVFLVGQ